MTPRATDWTLALLVTIGFATGGLTLYAGGDGDRWVFVLHGAGGFALAAVVAWKLRRVWPRLRRRELRDARSRLGFATLAVVIATLAAGTAWAGGITPSPLGFSLLAWHEALGAALMGVVAIHASARARLPARRRGPAAAMDAGSGRGFPGGAEGGPRRRDLLAGGAVAASGYAAWRLQPVATGAVGLRGERRRFTGSYEARSFEGNAFPSTSWVADDPRAIDPTAWRLAISGGVARPASLRIGDLGGDELVATLDCTGGFYSTQRWSGMRLDRVLAAAKPLPAAKHVRVVSVTGYRWSFPIAEAPRLLLATHVGDEPISHPHGAPLRLVAPQRRGFQWIKWVERIELTEGPDTGALASTVWSSFTRAGRGAV